MKKALAYVKEALLKRFNVPAEPVTVENDIPLTIRTLANGGVFTRYPDGVEMSTTARDRVEPTLEVAEEVMERFDLSLEIRGVEGLSDD